MTRRLCRKVVVCVDKGQVMSFVLRTGNFAVVDCILRKKVENKFLVEKTKELGGCKQ